MNTLTIKQQQDLREVVSWLRCGDTTPNPEMEEKFLDTITGIVKDRMTAPAVAVEVHAEQPQPRRRNPYGDRPHPLSLKAIMQEVTGNPNYELPKIEVSSAPADMSPIANPEAEIHTETDEIDSVVLARTLVCFSHENAHSINMSQLQVILYNAYGVFLAKNGKRLSDEHPQMWEYGPVFPKAYNRLKKNPSDGEAEAANLKETRPEVYEFLSQCFKRYAWTSASNLTAPHTAAGTPWTKTRKKSPDKWGAQIDDALISQWFGERI